MNNWNREEAKRQFRQNEILILKDQWFQQDLREVEMRAELDEMPLLPNIHSRPLSENGRTNRRQIQLNLDYMQMEVDRMSTALKRKMRHQQIENLQKIWHEQDMREAKAKTEAERHFRNLSI